MAALLSYLDSQLSLLAFLQSMDPDRDLTRAVAQTDFLMGFRWSPSLSPLSGTSESESVGEDGDSPDTDLEIAFQNGRNFRIFHARGETKSARGSGAEMLNSAASKGTKKVFEGPSEWPAQQRSAEPPMPPIARTNRADCAVNHPVVQPGDTVASTIWVRPCGGSKVSADNHIPPREPVFRHSPVLVSSSLVDLAANADVSHLVLDKDHTYAGELRPGGSPSTCRWSRSSDLASEKASRPVPDPLASPPTPVPRRRSRDQALDACARGVVAR